MKLILTTAAAVLFALPAAAQSFPEGGFPNMWAYDEWKIGPTPNGVALVEYFNSTQSETTTLVREYNGVQVEIKVLQTSGDETLIVTPLSDGHYAIPREQDVQDGNWSEVLIVEIEAMS